MTNELARNLKRMREKCNMSQIFVAEQIGVKNNTLSGYESGRREPDLETLKKLADLYQVSIDSLLGRNFQSVPKDNAIADDLSPESVKELEKYAELLKIKEMAEHNKKQHKESRSASGTDKQ